MGPAVPEVGLGLETLGNTGPIKKFVALGSSC